MRVAPELGGVDAHLVRPPEHLLLAGLAGEGERVVELARPFLHAAGLKEGGPSHQEEPDVGVEAGPGRSPPALRRPPERFCQCLEHGGEAARHPLRLDQRDPGGHLQPDVGALIRQAGALGDELQGLRDRARHASHHPVVVEERRARTRVARPAGEIHSLREDGRRLLFRQAEAPAEVQQPDPRPRGHLDGLGSLRQGREKLPHLPRAARRLGEIAHAGPLGRAAAPARGLEPLARSLPVVREERGALLQPVRVELDECPRHRGVRPRPPLGELRAVRHLVRQRMPERVLPAGMELVLVDHACGDQVVNRLFHLHLGELAHPPEHRLRELVPDHRCRLQERLLPLRQPVNPRCEQRLHARRDGEVVDRAGESIGAVRAGEVAGLDQRLDDLLDEEGVPGSAPADAVRERGDRGVAAEQVLEERRDGLRAERAEHERREGRPLRPARAVLGPEVHEEQRAPPGQGLDERRQERLARLVDPVEVLDEDDHRRLPAPQVDEPPEEGDEPPLPCLGIHPQQPPLGSRSSASVRASSALLKGVGDAEEVEQERERLRERGVE